VIGQVTLADGVSVGHNAQVYQRLIDLHRHAIGQPGYYQFLASTRRLTATDPERAVDAAIGAIITVPI
jgi:hypothetical protein